MIQDLKPYPAYKDSGVPWLGAVPEHWGIRSLGSLTTAISLRNRPDLPLLSVVREKGVIPRSSMSEEDNHNFIPDDLRNYKVVRPGNLVINKMKAWQGSLGIAPIDGIVSPAYYVFDLTIGDRRFGEVLLRSKTYAAFFARASDGVRIGQWDLSIAGMKRIPVVLPPLLEQAVIVRFLNNADRRIRRYISAKKKLIALLNEQKQAIIHRAVTRGLDPNVRLKPSGVEWLGDVPEHWEVSRLKFVASHIIDCLHATPKYEPAGMYPAIRTADIEPGRVRMETVRRLDHEQYLRWTARLTPRTDDILYSREGERYGLAALVPDGVQLCISQRMMLFRIKSRHVASYFMWQLNVPHVYSQASQDVIGSTSPHVNVETIKNFVIFVPPEQEQRAISSCIEATIRPMEFAVCTAKREIDLLREYRTRLIADVVTGKLDVREAAARLPDEINELEPLDDAEDFADDDGATDDADLDDAAEEADA